MKLFILLLLLSIGSYFTWYYATKKTKNQTRRFVFKHLLPVSVITLLLITGLVVMFYSRAINLL